MRKLVVAVMMLLTLMVFPGLASAACKVTVGKVPVWLPEPDKKLGEIWIEDYSDQSKIPENSSVLITLRQGKASSCTVTNNNNIFDSVQGTVYDDKNIGVSWGKRTNEYGRLIIQITADLTGTSGEITGIVKGSTFTASLVLAKIGVIHQGPFDTPMISASPVGPYQIDLSWEPVSSVIIESCGLPDGYNVLRSTPAYPNLHQAIATVSASVYQYSDITVTPGYEYLYAVEPLYHGFSPYWKYQKTTVTAPFISDGSSGGSSDSPLLSTETTQLQQSTEEV